MAGINRPACLPSKIVYNSKMRLQLWRSVSLSRKISLLLGTAVLLTIAVTLIFPWLQMTALDEQAMLLQAKLVASAARSVSDLSGPDWSSSQRLLDERWDVIADEIGTPSPPPQLVRVGPSMGPGFHHEATERLRSHPSRHYYWRLQDDGKIFRFAMAVRAGQTDPHPEVLRGIIDVRFPVAGDRGVWNTVVTILAGASGAVIAIVVFYIVTQRLVLTPVTKLRRTAEKVARGDTTVRANIKTHDEFEELSDAFDRMLTNLNASHEEQRKINRSLDVRLGELAETNVALYESNRMRSEFIANVSHELRTPLVSIIGFAELLRDAGENPDVDRKRLARYSQNILISGRSLLELINDLLDLAKIEAGELELHLTDFSLVELCRDMIDFVRPLADKRGLELVLELDTALPAFRSDSGRIKQVLYNLLSNAIKFTPVGGKVFLAARPGENGQNALIVRDTGPGIPPDKRSIVFEKFRQLDAYETREHEGTGLGLAITKDLVDILGGSIRLEETDGPGAVFTVMLPAKAPASARRKPISLT